MIARTIPALRQAVYAALTQPPLTYRVGANPMQTLPIAHVLPRGPWADGDAVPPDPMVNFAVGSRGVYSLQLTQRDLELKLWVSSGSDQGDTLVGELYEAVRERLVSTDAGGVNHLSRIATASTLPIAISSVRPTTELAADFEKDSGRWYVSATITVVAV